LERNTTHILRKGRPQLSAPRKEKELKQDMAKRRAVKSKKKRVASGVHEKGKRSTYVKPFLSPGSRKGQGNIERERALKRKMSKWINM
tara:strand:+ start:175 stop:438 length:264 start_codon:yes stop_codon:yes gene_type:complete